MIVRDLYPRDVDGLCELLVSSFRREYEEQGLDVWGFRNHYRLLAWANLLLRAVRSEFFCVSVAVEVTPGGSERVLGTLASFRAGPRAWYQGFGAVSPECRGRGVYKKLIRRTLEDVRARGGRIGGGEIRIDNQGALRPYRDAFGTEVLPQVELYLIDPRKVAEPELPAPLEPIGQARFDRLPEAPELARRFAGGFLLEGEAERGMLRSLAHWWLPPLTASSWGLFEGGKLRAFVRRRTHWPARIQALDAVWLADDLDLPTARRVVATALAGAARRTRAPVRVYAGAGDRRLAQLCVELGLSLLCPVYPIRTDVAVALSRTDSEGRPLAASGSAGTGAPR